MRKVAASALAVSVLASGAAHTKGTPLEGRYFMWFLGKSGYPAVLNFYWPEVQSLHSASRKPSEIADTFENLCLRTSFDQAKLANYAKQSSWGWRELPLSYAGSKSAKPFRLDAWRTEDATVQIWNGSPASFGKLPFYQLAGRLLITGYVDAKNKQNHILPQCNLQIALLSSDDASSIISSISARLNMQSETQEDAKRYAAARWSSIAGHPNTRISLYVDKRSAGEPILHLGIVRVPSDATASSKK